MTALGVFKFWATQSQPTESLTCQLFRRPKATVSPGAAHAGAWRQTEKAPAELAWVPRRGREGGALGGPMVTAHPTLSSRSLVPSPQIGELGWTRAKSPPFPSGEACKGSQELPRPRPLTSLTILPFPFLCPAPSFRSLSFPFCFLSHFSGSPFLLSSWTLPHPCPHGPFKSCFNLSPSPSHLCFSRHWHLQLAR